MTSTKAKKSNTQISTDISTDLQLHRLTTGWWVWVYPRSKIWIRDGKKGFSKFNFKLETLEDFIAFYDKFPRLQEGEFFLFRDGIFPEWESPQNIRGGRWSFAFDKEDIHKMWTLLCEACVAENLFVRDEMNKQVNGIEICYKKGYIKLWMKKCPETKMLNPSIFAKEFTEDYTQHPSCTNLKIQSLKFKQNESSYQYAIHGTIGTRL